MKLSEQLKQDHESGDCGMELEGYSERAEKLENKISDLEMKLYEATEEIESLGYEIMEANERD